ncbi:hypothetical protein [Aeromicrobium sp. 50.2.37]|uniref:hypothetical protein n=1 Tax=Aeromicrobium sp. 50.2.37 TaxID=2969305 RepID=UPI00214FACD7|nr:hypothetical protein [Aeromicrobium sp. 50.2.37]MCR4514305.1 hypothetical protein [Aeromicrobium sp. 50.2.37]
MSSTDVPDVDRPGPAVHPGADRAYVLGLLSVVGAVFVLPALLGPYVWHLGVSTRREIDRDPTRWLGRRRASAGMVLGALATALVVVGLLVLVGFAVQAHLQLSADTGY